MADYLCKCRTNYFKITDEAAFRALCESCHSNNRIEIFSRGEDENKQYGFLCDGMIYGIPEDPKDEDSGENYDAFISGLQELLPKGEAILLQEVGSEKFRYLIGAVLVITATETKYVEIKEIGLKIARELLRNPEYVTQIDY